VQINLLIMSRLQGQKKKIIIFFFVSALIVYPLFDPIFGVSPAAGDDQIILHYPTGNVVMEFGFLSISLEIPVGSADLIRADNNGKEAARIVPDLKYECFSVPLNLGLNKITITAMKSGLPIFTAHVNAFRRSDIESLYKNPPSDFKKDYFHGKDRLECSECHLLVPRESDIKPVSPSSFIAETFDKKTVIAATSTCYSCHNKLASLPYVHGPVAVWSCLSCHEADSEPKYAVKKPDTEVCFGCHTEQRRDWLSRKYIHGPVTIGNCAICHSPHSSDYPFNLYKSTWDLCVNCHAEKGSGLHVLGDAFSTEGHPTRNKPDPLRPGKDLSCASCHNAHASDYPHLWAFDVENMFELCTKCHYDK